MKAHFFDLDVLVNIDSKVWIVDKKNPNIPIMKISWSDFKLIKSGVFKSQGNKIEYNGGEYWLPTDVFNKLKIKLKVKDVGLGELGISLQEFLNKDIIENIDFSINLDVISTLKNTNDDIFVVCSRQTKKNYEVIIEKLEKQLFEQGLKIKGFIYILDSIFNQNDDDIRFKKLRLLLQTLVGYKNNQFKFVDEPTDRYENVYFYDNEYDTLKICDEINPILKKLLIKTDDGLKSVIREDIEEFRPVLFVNQISDNVKNRKLTKSIHIDYSNIIKTFENFSIRKR